jgi:hypothetical protein
VLKKKMLAKRPARVSPIIEVETHALAHSQNETGVVKLEAVYEDDKSIYIVRPCAHIACSPAPFWPLANSSHHVKLRA